MNNLNLPEHWEMQRLGEVADIFKGGTPKRSVEEYFQGDIPWAIPSDITALGTALYIHDTVTHISEEALGKSAARLLPAGTVLLTSRATIGETAIPTVPMATNQGFANFLCKEMLLNTYLAYYLRYIKQRLKDLATGSTFKEITKGTLLNVEIPLPSLPEQRSIAAVLAAIQEAKFARQKEIALERERKAALMDVLFSHGTKGEPRKQTEIGEIPESWRVVSLGEVTDIFKGGTPKRSVEKYFQGNIPWAIPTDITALRSALYIEDTATHISEEALGKSAARLLPAGTVLLTSRATIGETAIPTVPMATNQGFANFLCKGQILNVYLAYYLRYVKKRLIDLASGSTFKEVTKGALLKIEIPLPTLSEQGAIAEILKAFDAKTVSYEQETCRLDELFHAMLEELMTGKRSATPLIDVDLAN